MTWTWNFHSMCQIDQREGTISFAAIRRVLRELFAKNHGGPSDPPTSARVNIKWISYSRYSDKPSVCSMIFSTLLSIDLCCFRWRIGPSSPSTWFYKLWQEYLLHMLSFLLYCYFSLAFCTRRNKQHLYVSTSATEEVRTLHHHILTHSLTQPCTHWLNHALTHSLTQSCSHSLTQPCTHSFAHSLTQPCTHSLTHSTHSLTHSLGQTHAHILILIYTHSSHPLTHSVLTHP